MEIPIRILIIEDSENDALLIVRKLKKGGYNPIYERVETSDAMLDAIERQTWDIIVSDYKMPRFSGLEALKVYREKGLDIPFIIVSGAIGEDIAAEAMVSGAHDYVMKNNLTRLIPAIQRELMESESRKECRFAVEALRESENKYRTIFDSAGDAIFIHNAEARMLAVNPLACERLGYTHEELISATIDQLDSPAEAKKITNRMCRLMELGHLSFETLHQCKDGSLIPTEINARRINWNGQPAIMSICRDITPRKLAEEELKKTLEKLRKSLVGTIQALSATVETRDPYTAGHQRKVSALARAVAQEMGLPNNTVDTIRMAGIIHDIGKISIPAELLAKPTRLTDMEMGLIETHSQSGYDILKDAELPYPIADIVLQHHERLDGSGYPQGLKNNQILLESQILAVADVVEAIASHRPYRQALGINAALSEIEKNKGILYADKVVDVCLKLFREKGFNFE